MHYSNFLEFLELFPIFKNGRVICEKTEISLGPPARSTHGLNRTGPARSAHRPHSSLSLSTHPNPNRPLLPKSSHRLRCRWLTPAIFGGPRPRCWLRLKRSTTALRSIRVDLENAASPSRAQALLRLGFAVAAAIPIGTTPLDVLVLPDGFAGGGVWAGTGLVAVWCRCDWPLPPCRHGPLQASPGTPLSPSLLSSLFLLPWLYLLVVLILMLLQPASHAMMCLCSS
jgi:hypothetical protein